MNQERQRARYLDYLGQGIDGDEAAAMALEDELRVELTELCEADLERVYGREVSLGEDDWDAAWSAAAEALD